MTNSKFWFHPRRATKRKVAVNGPGLLRKME